MPNETWQSDFTHYRLATDGTRPTSRSSPGSTTTPATPCTSPPTPRVTAPIVLATFREAAGQHGIPGLHADRQRHGLHHPVRRRPRRPQRLRARAPPPRHRPEELPTQPPHHLRQGRAIPADPEEVAPRPTRPARPPSPSCRPSSTPSPTTTTTTGRTAPCRTGPPRPPLYAARCPRPPPATDRRPRHPRPGPPRPRRQVRHRHPAHRRPAAPHRHRPNPRRNLRHPARPRPRRSASSTPPPANYSATWSSTPAATTSPPDPKGPTDRPRNDNSRTYNS